MFILVPFVDQIIMQLIKQLLDEVEHDIIFYTESDV